MAFCLRKGVKRRLVEGDEPKKVLESEGAKMIKQQVKKQTDTKLTLEAALKGRKEFCSGGEQKCIEEKGEISLQEMKKMISDIKLIEDLALSKIEEDTSMRKAGLGSSGQSKISRDELETALAQKPGSLETKLFAWAKGCSSSNGRREIRVGYKTGKEEFKGERGLVEILGEAFSLGDPSLLAKSLREKRIDEIASSFYFEEERKKVDMLKESCPFDVKPGLISGWDQTLIGQINGVREKEDPSTKKKFFTCETLPDSSINKVKEYNTVYVKEDKLLCITLGKKTDEEIRSLPGFSNFQRGQPSEGLFIKNLGRRVSEEILGAVIMKASQEGNLTNEKMETRGGGIKMRLLGGKMRGQAFIGTQSNKDATVLLELLNGTVINGKPIVVQYSKRKASNKEDIT